MMKGGLGALMKQAQQMQENMRKAQEELATIMVEGQSGAGLVKVSMSCKFAVKKVTIDPTLVGEDKDMLEDLVMSAMNDAVAKAEAATQAKMAGPAAGRYRAARDPPRSPRQARHRRHRARGGARHQLHRRRRGDRALHH